MEENDRRIVQDLGFGRKLVNIDGKLYNYVEHDSEEHLQSFNETKPKSKTVKEVLEDLERERNDDEEEFMNLHEADDIMLNDLIRMKKEQEISDVKVGNDINNTNKNCIQKYFKAYFTNLKFVIILKHIKKFINLILTKILNSYFK